MYVCVSTNKLSLRHIHYHLMSFIFLLSARKHLCLAFFVTATPFTRSARAAALLSLCLYLVHHATVNH